MRPTLEANGVEPEQASVILVRWKRPLIGGLLSVLPTAIWLALLALSRTGPLDWPLCFPILAPLMILEPQTIMAYSRSPSGMQFYGDGLKLLVIWFGLGFLLANWLRKTWQALLAWLLVNVLFFVLALAVAVMNLS